ncbi:MAG: cryptochrome/photolyase family protein [Balneolales bacterium]|nr:cryptochrome/photolyase family protein [Balneolales bacterium]
MNDSPVAQSYRAVTAIPESESVTLVSSSETLPAFSSSGRLHNQLWFVHADQLNQAKIPSSFTPENTSLVFCESAAEVSKLPFHKKKITYIWSAQRHFAQECLDAGWQVAYLKGDDPVAAQLEARLASADHQLHYMMPAEYDLRQQLAALAEETGRMDCHPNTFFMSDPEEWREKMAGGYLMEYFYREMRKRTGYLMQGDKPEGGQWNFDKDNRKKLPAGKKPPKPVNFAPDEITREVMQEVEDRFPKHWGSTGGFDYAVDRAGALRAADDFFRNRFKEFGPYEDALVTGEYVVYHSTLSIYMNNGLLGAEELCLRALDAWENDAAPINSVEGYIRQIIGWREYIRNYYEAMMPQVRDANTFGFTHSIPESFWTGETKMKCISECVKPVLETGYSHHIPRLMVLSNYSNLTETDPRELLKWFWYGYLDAWEWVVLPNVLGMSTFADGGVLASKPYVSSGNYINKMGDYCKNCHYSVSQKSGPKACPFNYLYWNFVDKHQPAFEENGRVSFMLNMLNKKSGEERRQIREDSERYIDALKRYEHR